MAGLSAFTPVTPRAEIVSPATPAAIDLVLRVAGTVQGVGFRPFVARLAARYGVAGWVRNDAHGVTVRMRGSPTDVAAFQRGLTSETPAAARIASLEPLLESEARDFPAAGDAFRILASDETGESADATVTPDLALCVDCRRELLDLRNRRHRYPFINCTHCGPRYSILRELPYDRPHTTMAGFIMCAACADEYRDPANRRFHAQPNACPACGPVATLLDGSGRSRAAGDMALVQAGNELRAGRIIAVKGIGGFHLMADARCEAAVRELRRRKNREEKPLAVMFPSLAHVRRHAALDDTAADLLTSPAAPIVLVRRQPGSPLAPSLAPGNPWLGALLPYAPLQVLLLDTFGGPLVATSGNLSDEPLCIDNGEAVTRLTGIADGYLTHNRPIARAIDDSVVRLAGGHPIILRRARGFAPTPVPLPGSERHAAPRLCVGGHLKNTIALTVGRNVMLSPHIGDLDNAVAQEAFRHTIDLFRQLYPTPPESVVCDAHPDYASTVFARSLGLPVIAVQHHLAHILACLLEHDGGPNEVLGVAWDGTGYGSDGTIWGGEFILVDRRLRRAQRVGHLRPFVLPGGDSAVREPRRCLLGALYAGGLKTESELTTTAVRLGFLPAAARVLLRALQRRINCPVTTSAGRLFDAVAALLDLGHRNSFEGQAAMAVEFAADQARAGPKSLPFALTAPPIAGAGRNGRSGAFKNDRREPAVDPILVDWAPMLAAMQQQRRAGIAACDLAWQFHCTLSESIAAVAREVGISHVALTGGCFQNALLLELTTDALQRAGFTVLRHHELSPNDGSIAAGQALAAHWGITSVAP